MVSVLPSEDFIISSERLHLPQKNSHKGQNGKLLIIGGSKKFHAASIWAAEAASKVVDMVHYASTTENADIFLQLKSHFLNGMVIHQNDLRDYVEEDDCILIGPGMERGEVSHDVREHDMSYEEITQLTNEAEYTYALIRYLFLHYPDKKYVCDAAALRMMEPDWLSYLTQTAILTPHCQEFEGLFQQPICDMPSADKESLVVEIANKHNCVILFKQVIDIITDGQKKVIVSGGNAGLTKGGTGDALSGLAAAFYTTNNPIDSSLMASYIIKKSAEDLFPTAGLLFNTSDLIAQIPISAKPVLFDN